MITVVLADDHSIVRRGLRALLEEDEGCEVIGEAADGLCAIELIEELNPDVAILDVLLPDLDGLEVARRSQDQSPSTRIVMLSMHGDEPYVVNALRYGALGYVLKGSEITDLVAAVKAAVQGRRYLSSSLTERAIEAYANRVADSERTLDRYDLLTRREREILQLAAQGMANSAIGERLSISPRTAETHRTNLMRKLRLGNHTELVKFAIARGLVDPTD